MKKYLSMMMAVLFLFVTACVCFADCVDDNVAGYIEAGRVTPINGKKTEFSETSQKMTAEKELAYKTPETFSETQARLDTTPFAQSAFSERAHAMTSEKKMAYETNRLGIGNIVPITRQ